MLKLQYRHTAEATNGPKKLKKVDKEDEEEWILQLHNIQNILNDLFHNNLPLFNQLVLKLNEIRQNPLHFRNCRAPYQEYRHCHTGNYVVLFSVDHQEHKISVEHFLHHDIVFPPH